MKLKTKHPLLAILLLFFLFSENCLADYNPVIQHKVTNPVDNADNSAASFTSTPTVGNMIVVCVFGWRVPGGFDMPTNGVTDNQGNTYTRAVQSSLMPTANDGSASIFYAYNVASSGTFTITVDPTGTGNYFSWSATEVAGAARSSDPKDQTTSSTGSTNTPSTGTTSATAQNNEIVFINLTTNQTGSPAVESVTPAWNEIFEQTDPINHFPGEVDYRVISSSGTQSGSWTIGNTGPRWAAAIATFKLNPSKLITY